MKPKRQSLIDLIKKEISYDAARTQPEIICSHCGQIAQEEILSHWIDHRYILASAIARHCGLRNSQEIDGLLEDCIVSGNKSKDAEQIADLILQNVFV